MAPRSEGRRLQGTWRGLAKFTERIGWILLIVLAVIASWVLVLRAFGALLNMLPG